MTCLLVTGGAGFVGANFVRYWLRHHPGDTVAVLDALTYAGNRANLEGLESRPGYRFIHGDICDAELVADLMHQERVDCVVHLAAESHVDQSVVGPDDFIRTNIVGTHTLLKAANSVWRRSGAMRSDVRFHHVSTDEVYGSLTSSSPAFTETSRFSPNSPYSASKAASDHLVRAYAHTYGLPTTTSNCSNNYGPYQFPEKLIPLMLVRALEGKSLPVYGRGENVRDWLHVEDHCRAIDAILARGEAGEVYNVGGNNERRNIDVVRLLCDMLNRRFAADETLHVRFPSCPATEGRAVADLVEFVPDRPGHDWRYAIDARKVARATGFAPVERFEVALDRTVAWYLENEAWWRSILNGSYRAG